MMTQLHVFLVDIFIFFASGQVGGREINEFMVPMDEKWELEADLSLITLKITPILVILRERNIFLPLNPRPVLVNDNLNEVFDLSNISNKGFDD